MAWNEPGGGNKDPWSGKGGDQGPPDLDEVILVGGATYLTQDPESPFDIFTALPLLIYRWTTLPQAEFRNAGDIFERDDLRVLDAVADIRVLPVLRRLECVDDHPVAEIADGVNADLEAHAVGFRDHRVKFVLGTRRLRGSGWCCGGRGRCCFRGRFLLRFGARRQRGLHRDLGPDDDPGSVGRSEAGCRGPRLKPAHRGRASAPPYHPTSLR